MEPLYTLNPLCGSDFPSIGNKQKFCHLNSDPTTYYSSTLKNSKTIFIRILDQNQLFKIIIIQGSESEMNCLRGTKSTSNFSIITSYEKLLSKSFVRGRRDRQSFLRRSFHSVRKNVMRKSEHFMGKHFKGKPKKIFRSKYSNNNNMNILNDSTNFSTYNDRTLPNLAICDIVLNGDKIVPDTTSKKHQSR